MEHPLIFKYIMYWILGKNIAEFPRYSQRVIPHTASGVFYRVPRMLQHITAASWWWYERKAHCALRRETCMHRGTERTVCFRCAKRHYQQLHDLRLHNLACSMRLYVNMCRGWCNNHDVTQNDRVSTGNPKSVREKQKREVYHSAYAARHHDGSHKWRTA